MMKSRSGKAYANVREPHHDVVDGPAAQRGYATDGQADDQRQRLLRRAPTWSEIHVPCSTRDQLSRPRLSVPKKWSRWVLQRFELLHARVVALDGIDVVAEDGHDDDCDEDDERDHRQAVPDQAAEGVGPETPLARCRLARRPRRGLVSLLRAPCRLPVPDPRVNDRVQQVDDQVRDRDD